MDVVSSSYDATARVPPPAAAPRAAPMALRSSRAYGTYAPQARRPRTPPLPDVLLEELVVLLDLLPVLLGDGRVGLAPVEDHRTLRLLRRRVADAAAVVRDGRRHAVDARCGQPGHGAAEAVADHADLEAGLLRLLDGRADVLHRVVDRQLAAHGAAALDVRLLVARLEAALDSVEDRGRDGQVAGLREAVGDVLDVVIHAEDLLDHDQRAPRLSGRRGLVGGELVSVFGGQVDHLSH